MNRLRMDNLKAGVAREVGLVQGQDVVQAMN